jgi:hypothetical protein
MFFPHGDHSVHSCFLHGDHSVHSCRLLIDLLYCVCVYPVIMCVCASVCLCFCVYVCLSGVFFPHVDHSSCRLLIDFKSNVSPKSLRDPTYSIQARLHAHSRTHSHSLTRVHTLTHTYTHLHTHMFILITRTVDNNSHH